MPCGVPLAGVWCLMAAMQSVTVPLHVNTFPTARSLPFYVAVDKGFFLAHGLDVTLDFTESSERQRAGLADGSIDIVHAAVDNAVAMIDVAKQDIVIMSGGDSGTNEFYVQKDVRDFSDIRGRSLAVDATNTAYALQAKKILLAHGLREGDRLQAQSGGQRRAPAGGAATGQQQCRRHPQPALFAAGGRRRNAQPRPDHRHARALIRPAAHSRGATGRAIMPCWWCSISRPSSRRCGGRSIRAIAPRRPPSWSTS